MSILRHGKIERAIADEIAEAERREMSVLITSWGLTCTVFDSWDSPLTLAQRKAVTRAMHSFVRKHQQYALMGGQGRRELYLYDAADPASVMWTKLNVERRTRKRNPISLSEAKAELRRQLAAQGEPQAAQDRAAEDDL
jgi:hypothetical protein